WQFFSYSFVQLIDAVYIPWLILGVYFLYTIGNELEMEIGSARYLTLYFACGAYGAVSHALLQYFVPVFVPDYALARAATSCAAAPTASSTRSAARGSTASPAPNARSSSRRA